HVEGADADWRDRGRAGRDDLRTRPANDRDVYPSWPVPRGIRQIQPHRNDRFDGREESDRDRLGTVWRSDGWAHEPDQDLVGPVSAQGTQSVGDLCRSAEGPQDRGEIGAG